MKNRRKLRNFLINPRFQLRYILTLVLTGVVLGIAYSIVMYHHVSKSYDSLLDACSATAENKALLFDELSHATLSLGVICAIFLVVMAGFALVFSHRAAGPIYQFKKVIDEIKSGNTQARIHLRKGDDFTEIEHAFNEMVERLLSK
jgi:methyl-accepting chemotaxis protein